MDVDKAVQWIHSRHKFTKTPSLTRMQHLLHLLGNPEQSIRAIHIAGTNGKGSTATYLSQLLQMAGYNVGAFISPYIESFNERISLNGVNITDTELVKLVKKVKPLVEEMDNDSELKDMTEFDIITAMMFYYFSIKQPDFVILEVGLGGMYDSTNVISNPLLTAITTISDDHIDVLGPTQLDIAKQKLGIAKPEVPLVLGNLSDEVYRLCVDYATTIHAPVYSYNEEYQVEYLGYSEKKSGEKFTYKDQTKTYKRLVTPLRGQYQTDNAALALQLFDIIMQREKKSFSTSDIQKALNNAFLPGRMEIFQKDPAIILDGAHNPAAIKYLVENLKNEYKDHRIHLLFAAIKGKNYRVMIDELQDIPNIDLTLTTFNLPKAISCGEYCDYVAEHNITIDSNWRHAFFKLLKKVEDNEDIIVVTGSLYFISEVRNFLINGNVN